MNQKDCVSFESAKFLKEKGFTAKCAAYYSSDGEFHSCRTGDEINNTDKSPHFAAPTLWNIARTLREEHDISLEPMAMNDRKWSIDVYQINESCTRLAGVDGIASFEEAIDTGIILSLEDNNNEVWLW